MTDSGPVTTAGIIAVGNLEARIDGQVSRATGGLLSIGERAELVELLALRGHVLGRIAAYERAAAFADELVDQAPSDPRSFLARARMRGVFHRFASALIDLDTAAALGATASSSTRSAPRSIRRSDATTRRSRSVDWQLAAMLTSVRWRASPGSTASAARRTRRSAGSGRRCAATATPRRSRRRCSSSSSAGCG
jgi:hypothetical protein